MAGPYSFESTRRVTAKAEGTYATAEVPTFTADSILLNTF